MKSNFLVPFSEDTISRAKIAFAEKHGQEKSDHEYWHFLYTNYADEMIPFYVRLPELQDTKSSFFVPTREFPWSNNQIRSLVKHEIKDERDILAKKRDEALAANLGTVPPDHHFDITAIAVDKSDFINLVSQERITQYVPWSEDKILHFMVALLPKDQIPVKSTNTILTKDEALLVRMTLLRLWNDHELLRRYVNNLIPEPFLYQKFVRVASFDMMIAAYSLWNAKQKEFGEDRLRNLWVSFLIIQSYEFAKMCYPATTYKSLLTAWKTELTLLTMDKKYRSKFDIFHTAGGLFVLDDISTGKR